MKTIFTIILTGLFTITAAAQNTVAKNENEKPTISLTVFDSPIHQNGKVNYVASLSAQDLTNKNYVFYTDENATIAYITINGNTLKLTGGQNAEHIMAYAGNGYTVTLGMDNAKSIANPVATTLVIYGSNGQATAKKVTALQMKK